MAREISWFNHYKERKKLVYTQELFRKNLAIDRPYVELVKKYVPPTAKILECGCGPARTAISLAHEGFSVTVVDKEENILKFAKENAQIAGVKMKFEHMNFFDIEKKFGEDSFDCITHQGGARTLYSVRN